MAIVSNECTTRQVINVKLKPPQSGWETLDLEVFAGSGRAKNPADGLFEFSLTLPVHRETIKSLVQELTAALER